MFIDFGGFMFVNPDDILGRIKILEEEVRNLKSQDCQIIKYMKLDVDVPDPFYATEGSVAFDIVANSCGVIHSKETKLIGSGLKFQLPPNFFISVRPRSGISLKTDIWLKNSPGTIDIDYTGEVCLILYNSGDNDYLYERFDRLAQCLIEKSYRLRLIEESVIDTASRGSGGFGSTGIK